MAKTERLPLFPLAVVLFPQSQIPLHIFEERYKQLIADTLEHNTPFGINFVEEGRLHSIGCTARIAEVTKRYSDGKFDIIVEGVKRFQIVTVENPAADPDELVFAEVSWIHDKPETRDDELALTTIKQFNELCEIAYDGSIDKLDEAMWLSPDKLPSFTIAQKSGLEADQRQQMLGIVSENERLGILSNFLSQLLPRVKEIETMSDLIRNDGYIATWNKPK